jgi:hypothetical protein
MRTIARHLSSLTDTWKLLYLLKPWRQKPQVYHSIYKSLPPAPILRQLDPLYNTIQSY